MSAEGNPANVVADVKNAAAAAEAAMSALSSLEGQAVILVNDLKAVMAKYENDIVGTAHVFWGALHALIAKAKAIV